MEGKLCSCGWTSSSRCPSDSCPWTAGVPGTKTLLSGCGHGAAIPKFFFATDSHKLLWLLFCPLGTKIPSKVPVPSKLVKIGRRALSASESSLFCICCFFLKHGLIGGIFSGTLAGGGNASGGSGGFVSEQAAGWTSHRDSISVSIGGLCASWAHPVQSYFPSPKDLQINKIKLLL